MKIGDKIAVINDDLEGRILQIMPKEIRFISSDGFEYVYKKNQLILIQSGLEDALKNDIIKPKDTPTKKIIKSKQTGIPEFDLHIEKIQAKHQHLSNGQKLEIQIAEVKRIVHQMKIKHQKRFILIHGLGQGVLKSEIIKILKSNGLIYSQASFLKYGNGALEVEMK